MRLHTSYLVGLGSVLYELKVHCPPAVRVPQTTVVERACKGNADDIGETCGC